jgi:hypothetical protein
MRGELVGLFPSSPRHVAEDAGTARCKDKKRGGGDHQVREGTPGHKGEQLP